MVELWVTTDEERFLNVRFNQSGPTACYVQGS